MINLQSLQTFLDQASIPSVKQQPKTFLEIARQPHYENVISNIYAFYFDPHEEHGLGHLFINSFIECIKEQMQQEKNFLDDFQEFLIVTEYGTEEKGRIDLFLYNDEQAIIIENKIYHHLANNLEDYWRTARMNRKGKMVGVLLTLTEHKGSLHSEFVNILHLDFLKKVMGDIGNHLMEASEKYVTFLKDLYQNIENMSTKQLSDEDFNFYIKNQDKILDAVKFNDQAKDYIKTQIVNAWDNQPKLKVKSATSNTKQFYSYREIEKEGVAELYFCIWFDKLLAGKKEIWISIYLTGDNYKKYFSDEETIEEQTSENRKKLNEIIDSFSKYGIKLYSEPKKKRDWEYIAGKTYNLTDDQICKLQENIEGFIVNDHFVELFNELEAKLRTLSK